MRMQYRIYRWLGIACLGAAALLVIPLMTSIQEALNQTVDAPVRLAFTSNFERPILFTASGALLFPVENDIWQRQRLPDGETALLDVYAEPNGHLWFVGAHGLYRWADGQWTQLEGVPGAAEIEAMHGFTFVFSEQGVYRGPDEWRKLELPEPDSSAYGLAMLTDHSHATLQGETSLLRTHDMGLSWEQVEAPQPIKAISADAAGNLLAITDTGLMRWRWQADSWSEVAPLPDSQLIIQLQIFLDELYALAANGQLYVLDNGDWIERAIASDVTVSAMARRRLSELWVLESGGQRLWFSANGENWSAVNISIDE